MIVMSGAQQCFRQDIVCNRRCSHGMEGKASVYHMTENLILGNDYLSYVNYHWMNCNVDWRFYSQV